MRPRVVQINHLVSRGAYTGLRAEGLKDDPWTLEELEQLGFKLFPWDGR
jgi:hypothetical protein